MAPDTESTLLQDHGYIQILRLIIMDSESLSLQEMNDELSHIGFYETVARIRGDLKLIKAVRPKSN